MFYAYLLSLYYFVLDIDKHIFTAFSCTFVNWFYIGRLLLTINELTECKVWKNE
jgi:hypothetical protein